MPLLTGINHVAVMSADVDRFVAFYTEVFDADVVFEESTPFRHRWCGWARAASCTPSRPPPVPRKVGGATS